MEELQRLTHELSKIDPAVSDLSDEVEGSVAQMQELERSVFDYLGELDLDPEEVRNVEERFNLLETLKRKYGPTIEDAIDHAEDARQRLEGSDNREAYLAGLKDGVENSLKKLRTAARKLSAKRKKSAPALAQEIRNHLVDLGFKQGEFEVELNAREEPGRCRARECGVFIWSQPGRATQAPPASSIQWRNFPCHACREKCAR